MKKVLMTLAVLAASTSVMAQDIDNCYTMEVPPLMSVFGQAPTQKAYVQISSNQAGTLVAIRTASESVGNSMYASMCNASRGDLTCAQPFVGKGAVQLLKVQKTLNLNKVELAMEKSSAATKILGTHQNLKLKDISCQELINIFGK